MGVLTGALFGMLTSAAISWYENLNKTKFQVEHYRAELQAHKDLQTLEMHQIRTEMEQRFQDLSIAVLRDKERGT